MTETDITRIESSLGCALPGEYRDFLVRHADEVRRIKKLLPFRAVLWTDADEIIRQNHDARTYATAVTFGHDEQPWPDNFLVVGTNGGGDYWFIHCNESKPGVWFWQHEAHQIEQRNPSLRAYLEELRREMSLPSRGQQPHS